MFSPLRTRCAARAVHVRSRQGFTLIELLVVITIIATLVGLLLPAVQQAREASRRNTCTSNMHNLVIAMNNYESAHRYYPGFVNSFATSNTTRQNAAGQNAQPVSWVVSLFTMLDRNDLNDNWTAAMANGWNTCDAMVKRDPANSDLYRLAPQATVDPNPTAYYGVATSIAVLQCPSDPSGDTSAPGLSYVVNRGRNGWNADRSVGVCFDQYTIPNPTRVGLEYITRYDGAASTLLLSESLQTPQAFLTGYSTTNSTSNPWGASATINATNGGTPPTASGGSFLHLRRPNMIQTVPVNAAVPPWPELPGAGQYYFYRPFPYWTSTVPWGVMSGENGTPVAWTSGNSPALNYQPPGPNGTAPNTDNTTELDLGFEWSATSDFVGGSDWASFGSTHNPVTSVIGSRHGGIMISGFCDGHVGQINSTIDWTTFAHLMTPNGAAYRASCTSANMTNSQTNFADAPMGVLDESKIP